MTSDLECVPGDVVGEILFQLAEGLFSLGGHASEHPLLDATIVLELSRVNGRPRVVSLRAAAAEGVVLQAMAHPSLQWDTLEGLLDVVRLRVRRLLLVASLSRAMSRLVLPHWRSVYALVRVLGRFWQPTHLLPASARTRTTPIPPRVPAAWYRLAVVRYLTGHWTRRHNLVLRPAFDRLAPTLLKLNTPWEVSTRVRACGLVQERGKRRAHEPSHDDWLKAPATSTAWLRNRYNERRASERHAKAFQQRLAELWRRGARIKDADAEETSDDWCY